MQTFRNFSSRGPGLTSPRGQRLCQDPTEGCGAGTDAEVPAALVHTVLLLTVLRCFAFAPPEANSSGDPKSLCPSRLNKHMLTHPHSQHNVPGPPPTASCSLAPHEQHAGPRSPKEGQTGAQRNFWKPAGSVLQLGKGCLQEAKGLGGGRTGGNRTKLRLSSRLGLRLLTLQFCTKLDNLERSWILQNQVR